MKGKDFIFAIVLTKQVKVVDQICHLVSIALRGKTEPFTTNSTKGGPPTIQGKSYTKKEQNPQQLTMKVLLSASRESISVERVNEMSRFDTDLQPMVVGCQMQSTHNLVLRSHLLSFHGYCFLCSLDHVANSKQLQCIKGGLHILTLGEFTAAYIVSSVEYLSSVNLKAR